MSTVQKAQETQLNNILAKTGKSLAELAALAQQSGLGKHTELRTFFQQQLGLSYGDANALVHALLNSDGERAATASGASLTEVLDGIYIGAKAALRPVNDALLAQIDSFGEYERAAKKGYISLRRKKQFAMVGPANNSQLEIGLNMKGMAATERLISMPPNSMCQYRVRVSSIAELDSELLNWIQQAYENAG